MTSLLTIITFAKEIILLNDSFVIWTVFTILLIASIKGFATFLLDLFRTTRTLTRNEFGILVHELVVFFNHYQNNLETLIYLNANRNLLLPLFEDHDNDADEQDENLLEGFRDLINEDSENDAMELLAQKIVSDVNGPEDFEEIPYFDEWEEE